MRYGSRTGGPLSDAAPCERLLDRVRARLDAVEDAPWERHRMRVEFYARFGLADRPPHGYGNAELAFLAWEIRRGVLNPLDHPERPGSAWWRTVNRTFNLHSELAGAMWESGEPAYGAPAPVQRWLAFLAKPSCRAWYLAHTESIAAGVAQAAPLLAREPASEQAFVRLVIRRLGWLERLVLAGAPGITQLADPRFGLVRRLTANPLLYPVEYPHPGPLRRRMHPGAAPAALLVDAIERGATLAVSRGLTRISRGSP